MVKTPLLIGAQTTDYPQGLDDLEDSPDLYLLGSLRTSPGIAVVGTRRCTRYGIDLSERFGRVISGAGWTVVSGLARGIDAAAHRGCLAVNGHAVAVLGSGVDVCYPKENQTIYDGILESSGAIVSEYPPGTPPDRWRFPARNRIIAAMSVAVVVVEAARTGGALITARLAAEIGRPVFVVPGDIDRPASEGCNMLIRDGAHPVLGANDLVEELGLVVGPPEPDAQRTSLDIPQSGLTVDELTEHWSLPVSDTLARVGKLEIEGLVRRSGDRVIPG